MLGEDFQFPYIGSFTILCIRVGGFLSTLSIEFVNLFAIEFIIIQSYCINVILLYQNIFMNIKV